MNRIFNHMNWRLLTIILISIIMLITSYLTIVSPVLYPLNIFNSNSNSNSINEYANINLNDIKKINIKFNSKDEFIKFLSHHNYLNNHTAYYFFDDCPNYKLDFLLVDTVNGLNNYYLPEKGYLIILSKQHSWIKEPNFNFWKLDF